MRLLIFSIVFILIFQISPGFAALKVEQNKTYELYRLLLSALLGSNKLKEAEQLARKATTVFKNDPFWWKTYGEILIWNEKSQEALQPLLKAFELSGDNLIAEKAFRLALANGKYDIAKKLIPYVKATTEEKRFIYDKTADIENLIELFKKDNRRDSQIWLADILFFMDRKDEALEILEKIEKLYGFTVKEILLKANILYSEKRYKEALDVFKKYQTETGFDKVEFWSTYSDLAWMLQDLSSAKYASSVLINSNNARYEDYDRVSTVLSFEDPEKAIKISFTGWEKLKSVYLLQKSFYLAYLNEKWEIIIKMFSKDEPQMINDDNILIAYLTALQKKGRISESLTLMDEVLKQRFSKELLSFYLYSLVDAYQTEKLKKVIKSYESYQFEPELPSAFAVAYLNLQQGQKAYNVYKKGNLKDVVLLADILELLGKEAEAKNIRIKEFKKLSKEARENPENLKNPEFLRQYLSLAIYNMKPPQFEKVFFERKDVLAKSVWQDIYLSYLLYNEKKEKTLRLAKFYKYPLKPWMWLNIALWQNDTFLMSEILSTNIDSLPIRDRVVALQKTGEIKKALHYAFKGLDYNPYDSLLYKEMRDAIVKYEDHTDFNVSFIKRRELSGIETQNTLYLRLINKGYGLGLQFNTFNPFSKDPSQLIKTPFIYSGYAFIEKIFDRGLIKLYLGEIKRLNENFSSKIEGEIETFQDTTFFYEVSYNKETDETTYLLLGGMKDNVKFGISHNITPRTLFIMNLEKAYYKSSDKKNIGDGINFYTEIQYKLRTGYPDFTIRLYNSYGKYSEKEQKGNISQLSPYKDFKALPESFDNIGMGFNFGYENRDSYVRVWRPFLSFDAGYNTVGGVSFGFSGGIGGSIFKQDSFSTEISYSKNIGGLQDYIFKFNLLYKIWF